MTKVTTLRLIPAMLAIAFSGAASASAFQLLEQNGAGQGNAFAGSAATAENASTVFFNPAGMTALPGNNVSMGISYIDVSSQFSNGASVAAAKSVNPATGATIFAQPLGGESNGGTDGWVPNAYFTKMLDDKWAIGFGMNAPFGLRTSYSDGWVGRYQALESSVKTLNFNPSIAYKFNDQLSLGFGFNVQKARLEFTNATDSALVAFSGGLRASCPTGAAACIGAATPTVAAATAGTPDGFVKTRGEAWGAGWNAGLTYDFKQGTKLGLSYRSKITHEADVTANLAGPTLALSTTSVNGKATITVPDTVIASLSHKLNDRWELLGDVSWTGWSSIPQLRFTWDKNTILGDNKTVPYNWKDTWRVAVGGNYAVNDQWKIKAGIARDQSPVSAEYRTARLPDNDRWWYSLGAQFKPTKTMAVDLGYTYIKADRAKINDLGGSAAASGVLEGSYNAHVHIIGTQFSMGF